MAVHHAVGISRQRNSGYTPSRVNIMAQRLYIPDPSLSPTHHRLRGSASTVLTATGQVNGRWRILTPYRIETHEPTAAKFRTIDYVHGRTP